MSQRSCCFLQYLWYLGRARQPLFYVTHCAVTTGALTHRWKAFCVLSREFRNLHGGLNSIQSPGTLRLGMKIALPLSLCVLKPAVLHSEGRICAGRISQDHFLAQQCLLCFCLCSATLIAKHYFWAKCDKPLHTQGTNTQADLAGLFLSPLLPKKWGSFSEEPQAASLARTKSITIVLRRGTIYTTLSFVNCYWTASNYRAAVYLGKLTQTGWTEQKSDPCFPQTLPLLGYQSQQLVNVSSKCFNSHTILICLNGPR